MSDLPLPEITPLNHPYWAAIERGELVFQQCTCGHRWLPARSACPNCLKFDAWAWTPSAGKGRVISWVVYHTAYHAAFASRVPYNVAIVELDEGPRLITNILAPNNALAAEMPVRLSVELESGFPVARFAPV